VTLRVRLGFLSRVQVSHGGIDGNDLLAQQRKMKISPPQKANAIVPAERSGATPSTETARRLQVQHMEARHRLHRCRLRRHWVANDYST